MNLVALDLPEDIHDWPVWLERQVVGLHLREWVQQVEVISGGRLDRGLTLDSILGDQRDKLLQSGLRVLDEGQLRELVQNPRLMLNLQELVLVSGGEHWRRIDRDQEQETLLTNQWARLQDSIGMPTDSSKQIDLASRPSLSTDNQLDGPSDSTNVTRQRWLIAAMTLAAGLLVAFLPWWTSKGESKFFARHDVIQSELVGVEFLRHMALSVRKDWKPEIADSNEFEKQLMVFRNSCDVLLSANINQLEPTVAKDLKDLCQKWRDKISRSITDLAAGKPLAEVRQEANATLDRIVPALRELEAKISV